ncbi:MAG: SLBB domain-containing protein [Ignavibacteriaceae bacterium]|nr:SLBB domain-containing protein [Ignavibacteriaceae bacterium]
MRFILFLVLFLLGGSVVYSQTLPEYFERKSLTKSDSLQSVFSTVASDGVIEADNYFPGPGDRFLIVISGLEETVHQIEVNHEGQIYIPRVGGIDVNKKSLTRLKNEIRDAINRNYKNVTIFISLNNLRRIKVYVGGDVSKPGSYILFANSRLSDLIYQTGILPTTSIRSVKITHREGEGKIYDCLTFFRLNDRAQNPYLQEGDFIFFDKVTSIVNVNGAVKFPGTYELKAGESMDELIELCGGLLPEARVDSIELISFEEDKTTQFSRLFSYNHILSTKIILSNKDRLIIRTIPKYLEEDIVTIEGYVRYPGPYKIKEGVTTLSQIIEEAGGLLPDASLIDATLRRDIGVIENDPEFERLKLIPRVDMTDDEYDYFKSKSRQRKGRVVVDFVKLFKDKDQAEDIILSRDDKINFPKKKDYIVLIGQVVNPGNVEYNPAYTIDDYIRLAGGLGWRALEKDIRLVRGTTGEWVEMDDVEKIFPGDIIWIPEDPPPPRFWDVFETSLNILGQIATVVAATVAVIVSVR